MNTKIDDATKDRILDELLEKHPELDDLCHEIFFTLLAYKKLRFNELLRTLKKLGIGITQPTLKTHLLHLIEKGIVEKEEGFQFARYSLKEEINSAIHLSTNDLKKWVERFLNDERLPKHLQPLKITAEEFYQRLTDTQLDELAVKDLGDILSQNLHELKNFINYDLEIGKFESDAAFWNFVGNPLYRMREKSVVERCRASNGYKKKLFEKIDLLISELRSDKELFRIREERRKKRLKK